MIDKELFILNPDYILKNDVKRSLIIANSDFQCEQSNPEWISIIHPAQAMILSFFSTPITLDKAIENLSYFLRKNEEETKKIITPFIENVEAIFTTYNGFTFKFPKKIIIKHQNNFKISNVYSPEDFTYQGLDFKSKRLIHSPATITFMVTNKCVTKCIYCYADRNHEVSCTIPFERISELIKEAKDLKIKDIHIGGGEFFLYDKWYELLVELNKNGFERNLISTKVPIREADVLKLKQFPSLVFQFSFDSTSNKSLQQILGVSDNYVSKMKETLKIMDKHGIPYHVMTILTNLNSNNNDLKEMFSFLSSLKMIRFWQVRIAFRSLYTTTEFESIKLQTDERNEVLEFLEELNNLNTLKVDIDKSHLERGYFTAKYGSKSFPGAFCSANRSHMYILPEGNVTICEQMYWKKRFIIGNILENSIEEVWNSQASLKWVNMKKEDFRDKSACKNCEMLDECYNKYPNKCWADVLKVYGDENWDFPDPRCNKAPAFINPII